MRFLRTNTAIRVTVGPFFDKTDGVTPEVALTVTACKLTLMVDDANVPTLVLDTAPTASGGANDMVHVTGDDAGFYDLELAAANVNYLGRAMLAITDAATHCPVFHEFMILPANVYDSLVLGTDALDVSAIQLAGQTITAGAGVTFPSSVASPTNITAGTITTVTNLTNAPTAGDLTATMKTSVTTAATAATPVAASVTGNVGGNVTGSVGSVVGAVGSVTGAVASVTGAVGSVTGNVGGNVTGSVVGAVGSVTGAVGSVTGNVGGNVTGSVGSLATQAKADVNAEVVDALTVDLLADSVHADGTRPTFAQAMYEVIQHLTERSVSGTTVTVKKVDGSTTLCTLTLNDATTPTSITRA